jgi:A nuclease family of the HNH/ENDO VII superfamily with conserved AHH
MLLSRTDAWCTGIPQPPEWAQPLLQVCPEPIANEATSPSPKQFLGQTDNPPVKSPLFCNQPGRLAPTTQELILLRARNDAYQMAYQQAERIAKALTIAEAEMQEVLNKDDWTLRNLLTSHPETIEAIQARVAHELDSIEAPPAYDDPSLDGLALAGFQKGFEEAKFKAQATLFAIDAGWVVLDIAVTEVILGPLGGAKLAASGLAKGSKALKAAVTRLGDIPIYLPVGVGAGGFVKMGQFVNVSKIVASISGSAHRYRLEKALKKLTVPILRGKGESLHHIVAWDDERAKLAREVLKKFKIDIDDAANGVFLPATTKSVNPKGALVHSTLHTDAYYEKIDDLLIAAKTRADAIQKLKRIRETLLDGTFHHAKI